MRTRLVRSRCAVTAGLAVGGPGPANPTIHRRPAGAPTLIGRAANALHKASPRNRGRGCFFVTPPTGPQKATSAAREAPPFLEDSSRSSKRVYCAPYAHPPFCRISSDRRRMDRECRDVERVADCNRRDDARCKDSPRPTASRRSSSTSRTGAVADASVARREIGERDRLRESERTR